MIFSVGIFVYNEEQFNSELESSAVLIPIIVSNSYSKKYYR